MKILEVIKSGGSVVVVTDEGRYTVHTNIHDFMAHTTYCLLDENGRPKKRGTIRQSITCTEQDMLDMLVWAETTWPKPETWRLDAQEYKDIQDETSP